MGLAQTLLLKILPAQQAAKMEAESRAWRVRCDCGHETSIWELGGVRWGASGKKSIYAGCAKCGKSGMKTVYHREDAAK